jgi:hypothetical protein
MFIGFLEEKLMKKNYINLLKSFFENFSRKISKKQRQWLWFVALWLFGLCSISLISYLIKVII